jgi:hypothetical protein
LRPVLGGSVSLDLKSVQYIRFDGIPEGPGGGY